MINQNSIQFFNRSMKKRLFSFLAFCLMAVGMAFAQQKVTGSVIDVETGEPVIGASVVVKDAGGIGAATDMNRNFTIQNVPNAAKLRAPDKPCGEDVRMLPQNCRQTIHEERDVSDSFHLCSEAFDL